MQRTNFGDMACSIARTLDVIGEPWSPLILRDVWAGLTRFEQIQADLGISRKVLTERLNHLVERGVLERRPYDRRPRFEYGLTEKGADLIDLLMVMAGWGDKWLAGAAGPPVVYRHRTCGRIGRAGSTCAHCGAPMRAADVELLPGPSPDLAAAKLRQGSVPGSAPGVDEESIQAGVPTATMLVSGVRRRDVLVHHGDVGARAVRSERDGHEFLPRIGPPRA
jgi:DNA-binding HxlR family transcriptional regulator